MKSRLLLAAALSGLAVATSSSTRAAPSANNERARLLGSLRTSCRQFSRDDQWQQLDACHRDWFKAHEEAVWRLKLNPHDPKTDGPSS